MPRFEVAWIKEKDNHGNDVYLVIIPLESAFGTKSGTDQQQIISDLQIRANSSGLAGTVVPVWDSGLGRMGFIAPPAWHPYFRSVTLERIAASINKQLSW